MGFSGPVTNTNGNQINEELQSLDDLESLDEIPKQVDANIAPPTLDVASEDLTSNVQDISASNNIETYGPVEEKEEDNIKEIQEEDKVNIDIPKVKKPVETVDMPSDGSAPSIDDSVETVGEPAPQEGPVLKVGKKRIKLNFKGNKSVPQLICIIGIVVFFILGLVIGKVFFSTTVYSNTRKNTNQSNIAHVSDGKNNVTHAGDYTYTIPEDYLYDRFEDGVLIYDDADTWRIYIRADLGLYDDLANAKTSVRQTLIDASISVRNINEINVNDQAYLIVEGTTTTYNRLIAFTDAKNDHVFYIEIVNSDNDFDYDVLEIADDIVKNAELNESVSNMENVDVYDISALALRAAEAYKALQ